VTLNNLGGVACMRGDPAAGESFFRRALTIRERIAPGSIDVATTLNNVGVAALDHGELAAAEDSFRRALQIIEKLAPDSFEVARIVGNLGNVAHQRGDFAAAEAFQRRTNAIMERLAPGSLDTARSLSNLAETARELGRLGEAEDLARKALAVIEVLAPGSTDEARILYNLGQILVDAGRPDAGLTCLSRSVNALETQQEQLGGARQELGAFRAQHLVYYRALIDLLLELEHPEAAFHVLERSRARTLLAILAERSLVFSTDLPDELELERQSLRDAGHRVVDRLSRLSTTDRDQIAALRDELHRLHQEQARIRTRVRAVSPRLAALTYPQPLTLKAASAALDPGTLLLVYSLGHGTSHLFAVSPRDEGLAVFDLATSAEEVREATDRFRRLILRPDSEAFESSTVAGELADRLLGAAMDSVGRAERMLIVPDGPLHVLPFAALASQLATGNRHLVEIRPLTTVASATVLSELIKERGTESERHVVAFGDPDYRAAGSVDAPALLACAVRDGLRLDPLPATRAEVKAIGELYGDRARLWLGAEATEERAGSVGGRVTIVHFAVHGLIDERFPLESALVLTIPRARRPAHEDGLLQAWEVFERLRLDADLVTLSSCNAALGEELAGEGIIGLTRAFQYAGARTVLASLWSVADVSTAELMRRFYTSLEGGDSKDVALQKAQMEFIQGPVEVEIDGERAELDLSHPFHWAAFQLIGDWR
jgi:CHAT domain-containing protein/Tfp pilus assembly protein PilF